MSEVVGHMNGKRPRAGRCVPRSLSIVEVSLLAFAVLLLFAIAGAPRFQRAADVRQTTVRVDASDTLWTIARTHPLPGKGTDATVRAIREMNGLAGSRVAEGQVLTVPDTSGPQVASR